MLCWVFLWLGCMLKVSGVEMLLWLSSVIRVGRFLWVWRLLMWWSRGVMEVSLCVLMVVLFMLLVK